MTLSTPPQSDDTVLTTYTDWPGYQKFLAAVEGTGVRVTYDRGRLELMTPSRKHERSKKILAMLIEHLAVSGGRAFEPGGAMTFSRQDLDRGLEPDECYWFQNYERVAGRDSYDSAHDPPPDLVLEVDVTASSVDRIDMYWNLGVEEVWQLTEAGFRMLRLGETYREVERSGIFRDLTRDTVESYLEKARRHGITSALRSLPQL